MKLLLVVFIFLLFSTTASAAPGPTYLVVNDNDKICGEYWTGDEFGQNNFPDGWRVVDEENFYPLECLELEEDNLNEECCKLLNYEYVDDIYSTTPSEYTDYRKILPIVIVVGGITFLGIWFVIMRRLKYNRIHLNMSGKVTKAK